MKIARIAGPVTIAALLSLAALSQAPPAAQTPKSIPAPTKGKETPAPGTYTAVQKKDVPGAVTASFSRVHPKADLNACYKQEKDGKTVYLLEGKEEKILFSVLYTSDGEALETRENFFPTNLPAAVKKVVNSTCSKCAFVKCERVTRGTSVFYAMLLNTGNQGIKLQLDAAGKPVE